MPAVLGAAWVLVAVTVAADWWARWRGPARLETIAKPAATVAIGALALVVSDGGPATARVAAGVGFALCLVGDVALLDAVDDFVLGLASFLLGHVAFVVMFVALGLDRRWLGLVAVAPVGAVAATVGQRIVAGARAEHPALVGPVLAYLAVISSMTVVGWATGRTAAVVGASLFVTSDSILGWRKFVGERRWMAMAVMVTYHGALVGLALSLA